MALTIEVVSAPGVTVDPQRRSAGGVVPEGQGEEALRLTFDSPRLVIGRGEGCEVRLPDPTVSHRHASIRQRGPDYIVVDEGSENGTFIDNLRLAPHSPRVLRSGEHVRVGRVWLALEVELAMPNGGPASATRMALELVRRSLVEDGEDPRPRIRVKEGVDAGRELRLVEGRAYVIGRAKGADLQLTDSDVSRRHVELQVQGDSIRVRDLGTDQGSQLDGERLESEPRVWRPGVVLEVGETKLTCEHELVRTLAEMARSPGEHMRPGDVPELPGAPELAEEEVIEAPSDAGAEPTPSPAEIVQVAQPLQKRRRESAGWGFADLAVMLVALGVLGVSVGGLVFLMRSWA